MNLIKLDATESTNTFLKDLCKQKELDDFTVVVTGHQTNGRGQMGAIWNSEKGKNLMFSVLIKHSNFKIVHQFYLSKIVSLAVFQCLKELLRVKLEIKWPNDILAEQLKIAGILIENSVKRAMVIQSVIGVGLNVNQELFKDLPKAISMKLVSGQNFDLDFLLRKLVESLKENIDLLKKNQFDLIDKMYLEHLYRRNAPAMFKDNQGVLFMGKITGVSENGKLQMELENEKTHEFDLKEIEFVSS